MVPYPFVALVNLELSLREERSWHLSAAPCRWLPDRTRSRVEVFLKTVCRMMGIYCHINGETMVSFKPIFLCGERCVRDRTAQSVRVMRRGRDRHSSWTRVRAARRCVVFGCGGSGSRFFFSCLHLLDCDDKLQDVRPIKNERSLQQMAKWRNLARYCPPVPSHCCAHAFRFSTKGCPSSLLLPCPRVCLLDVSCLLSLTLRLSAPVSCCHRDSLTRGRAGV